MFELYLADTLTLSRVFVFLQDSGENVSIEQRIESIGILEYLSVSQETRNHINEAMKSDQTLSSLLEALKSDQTLSSLLKPVKFPDDKNTLPSGV